MSKLKIVVSRLSCTWESGTCHTVARLSCMDNRLRVAGIQGSMMHMAHPTDWEAIEKWMIINNDFPLAAKTFEIKENTIRKRASRYHWPLRSIIERRAAEIKAQPSQNQAITEHSAKTLAERGESHAAMVFEKANAALLELKKFPVKNARDVEVLDRVARRSAGMGNDDEGVKISLIALNESINAHADDSDVIEGEIVSVPSEPIALPEQNAGA